MRAMVDQATRWLLAGLALATVFAAMTIWSKPAQSQPGLIERMFPSAEIKRGATGAPAARPVRRHLRRVGKAYRKSIRPSAYRRARAVRAAYRGPPAARVALPWTLSARAAGPAGRIDQAFEALAAKPLADATPLRPQVVRTILIAPWQEKPKGTQP